jgi:hypothetical protein
MEKAQTKKEMEMRDEPAAVKRLHGGCGIN